MPISTIGSGLSNGAIVIKSEASSGTNIAELHERELAVQRLAAIVSSSEDAIVAKDLNGIITSWNEGAERLFGYSAEEAIGKSVTILIPPERPDEEPGILARLRAGERVSHYETIRRRKDGTLIDISLSVSPVKDAHGRIVGASKIARDISERKQAEERMNLLLREMNHRIKNLFTVAGSIVSLSVREASTHQDLALVVQNRLAALARAHELTLTKPAGDISARPSATTLHALIKTILLPFEGEGTNCPERVTIAGPDLKIGPGSVTSLALLFHEIATNAAKYGALSTPLGRIDLECKESEGRFTVMWRELGGPPPMLDAEEEGFGRRLIETTVKRHLQGELAREYAAEGLTL